MQPRREAPSNPYQPRLRCVKKTDILSRLHFSIMQCGIDDIRIKIQPSINALIENILAVAVPGHSITNDAEIRKEQEARKIVEEKLEGSEKNHADHLKICALQTQIAVEKVQSEFDKFKFECDVKISQITRKAESEIKDIKYDANLSIEKAKAEIKAQNETAMRPLIDCVKKHDQESKFKDDMYHALEAKFAELQKQSIKMLPGEQGTAGESEIETYLRHTMGHFMFVKNVSKEGQGHEMDLELVSRDGTLAIRIDVKSHKANLLPEAEIARFYADVDRLASRATAAILFMRPALRGNVASNVIKSKRGKTDVYQIGGWSTAHLIETIHQIHVDARHANTLKVPSFNGTKEIHATVTYLCDLIAFTNKQAANVSLAIEDWKAIGAEKNRQVAESLRIAHAANPNVVTQKILAAFEASIPKRARGGKRNVKRDEPFASDSDSSDTETKKKKAKTESKPKRSKKS